MQIKRDILQRPFFYDAVVEQDVVYFPVNFYNALCKGNLITDQVEILTIFPKIPTYIYCAYKGIYKFKDYLLFSSHDSCERKDILLYDIKSSQFIRLPNKLEITFDGGVVFECIDKIYFLSRSTAKINVIDVQEFTVRDVSYRGCVLDNARITELVKIDNLVYIPVNQKKVIFILDINSEKIRLCDFPANISFIATLCFSCGKFFITGESRKLYIWTLGEKMAYEREEFPADIKLFYNDNIWFRYSFIHQDVLWLFPFYATAILKYNLFTQKFEKVEIAGEEEGTIEQIDEEIQNGRCFASKYGIVRKYSNRVFFLSSKTRIFYELDLQTNIIVKHDFRVIHKYKDNIYPLLETYYTGYRDGVEFLIENIKKNATNNYMGKKDDKLIGKAINNHINS